MTEQHSNTTTLIILCLVYTMAAADEYWVLDWMKELYGIKLAIFAALLQNASWPVQIYFYSNARKQHLAETGSERVITPSMYKSYAILGFLSAFITLSRTIGITSLPASIYVICANTEIVFETIMTKIILRREVSWLQLFSVGLVLSGVLISLYNPSSNKYGDSEGVSQSTLLVGVVTSLLSRFASSLNTVLADRFLGKDAKSRMGVLECSLANSLIPCLVLPIALAVTNEQTKWPDQLANHSAGARVLICIFCLIVTASKHADRLAKFSIVSMTSTMFFAAVDSNMKVVAGIGSFLFFHEDTYWSQIIGFVLIFFALIVMFIDKRNKAIAAAAAAAEKEKASQIESPVAEENENPMHRVSSNLQRTSTIEMARNSSLHSKMSFSAMASRILSTDLKDLDDPDVTDLRYSMVST